MSVPSARSLVLSASVESQPDPSLLETGSTGDADDEGGDDESWPRRGVDRVESAPLGEEMPPGAGVDISVEEVYVTG